MLSDGFHYGVLESEYHGEGDWAGCLSSSLLRRGKTAGWGPASTSRVEVTKDMRLGSYIHMLTLQPQLVDYHYAVFDDEAIKAKCCTADGNPAANPRATKEYKALKAEFDRSVGSREVINAMEDMMAKRAAQQGITRLYPKAHITSDRAILEEGTDAEVSLLWTEHVEGHSLRCKARLDLVDWQARRMWDIKTSSDTTGWDLGIWRSQLHIQIGWYVRGMQACGVDMSEWEYGWVVLQQDGNPDCCGQFLLDPKYMPAIQEEINDRLVEYTRFLDRPQEYGNRFASRPRYVSPPAYWEYRHLVDAEAVA